MTTVEVYNKYHELEGFDDAVMDNLKARLRQAGVMPKQNVYGTTVDSNLWDVVGWSFIADGSLTISLEMYGPNSWKNELKCGAPAGKVSPCLTFVIIKNRETVKALAKIIDGITGGTSSQQAAEGKPAATPPKGGTQAPGADKPGGNAQDEGRGLPANVPGTPTYDPNAPTVYPEEEEGFFSKYKWPIVIGGLALLGGGTYYLLRKRRLQTAMAGYNVRKSSSKRTRETKTMWRKVDAAKAAWKAAVADPKKINAAWKAIDAASDVWDKWAKQGKYFKG